MRAAVQLFEVGDTTSRQGASSYQTYKNVLSQWRKARQERINSIFGSIKFVLFASLAS